MNPDSSNLTLSDRVELAEGTFSEKLLKKTTGRLSDKPLVEYLDEDEHLAFVLYHHMKGLRTIPPNGPEQTSDHLSISNSRAGSRYLLITDKRICYVAGFDSHDEVQNFDCDQLIDVSAESGIFTHQLTFTTTYGTSYRFADSGHHASDIEDILQYIKDRIQSDVYSTDDSESKEDDNLETTADFDDTPTSVSTEPFSRKTGLLAGLSSLVLSFVLFSVMSSTVFPFPVFALDPATYGQSMTNSLWGGFIGACSLGIATGTTFWYSLKVDQRYTKEMAPPMSFFILILVSCLVLFAGLWFLRTLLAFILLVLALVLVLGGPIMFLYGLAKTNWAIVTSSLVLLVVWIAFLGTVPGDNGSISASANFYVMAMIAASTATLPPVIGNLAADTAKNTVREQRAALADLDAVMRDIDHEYLESLGLELQYKRAGFDIEDTDSQFVFTDTDEEKELKYLFNYYSRVAEFEDKLSSDLDKSDEPAATKLLLCEYLEQHSPEEEIVDDHLLLFNRASNLLESYPILQEHNNRGAVSELEERLRLMVEECTEQNGSNTKKTSHALEELEDLNSWLTDRVRATELASRRGAVLNAWNQSVTSTFGPEIDVLQPLPESIEQSELPLEDIEAQLDVAEDIISLATTVSELDSGLASPLSKKTKEAVCYFLIERTHPNRALSESVSLLHKGVRTIQLSQKKQVQYPELPFGHLTQELVSSIQDGSISEDTVRDMEKIISDTETILSFLQTVDTAHPSVSAEDWRNSIHTALKNGSTEILNPPIRMIERMGDTLWEQNHLHMFSWDEFEYLVGRLYENQGYTTNVTQQASDGGVDVWASGKGSRIAIQVKQFSSTNKVGRPDVQKLASTIAKGDADRAIVVTSSSFTNPARTYAADFGEKMELVDGSDLIQLLSTSEIPPPIQS